MKAFLVRTLDPRKAALFLGSALPLLLLGCSDDPAPAAAPPPDFVEPPELAANADGVRELHFGPHEVEIDGKRYCLRAYNGMVPGPTIRVPAGSDRRVRVDLFNEHTKSDYREIVGFGGMGEKSCHDFNVTNLHAHGSHIQPNYATADAKDPCTGEGCGPNARYHGDHVLITVDPGKQAKYRWDLDEDGVHHAGTNWYHPHVHGATAIQVSNGASGALIIEGDIDQVPGVAEAKERVMVLNQLPLDSEKTRPLADGESCADDTLSVQDFLSVTESMPTLLNGKRKPRIVAPPGQVERWRVVYSGNPDEVGVTLHVAKDDLCQSWEPPNAVDFVQIARDGITLPQFYTSDTMWVSPGYRIDTMVKMPAEKQTLCLVNRRITDPLGAAIAIIKVDEGAGAPASVVMPEESAVGAVAPKTTWMGSVDGQMTQVSCESVQKIHQKLVLLAPTPGEKPTDHSHETGVGSCSPGDHGHAPSTEVCLCPAPNISCRNFEDRRAWKYRSDRVMTVDTSEKWEINAFDGHPFHIHINPFLVCPNNSNKEPNFAHFRDTFWVQAEDGPRELMMSFRKFTGQYVLHCHKLNHEDEGMMELQEVCAPGDADCLCLGQDANGDCISNAGCQANDLKCQYAKDVTDAYPLPPPPNPALCSQSQPPPP